MYQLYIILHNVHSILAILDNNKITKHLQVYLPLLSGTLPVPGFGDHGVPYLSIFKYFYRCRLLNPHPNTEALCIGNSLFTSAMLSFDFSAYAKVFYSFIFHGMSKEANASPSYSN